MTRQQDAAGACKAKSGVNALYEPLCGKVTSASGCGAMDVVCEWSPGQPATSDTLPVVLALEPIVGWSRGGTGALLLGDPRPPGFSVNEADARAHCWYHAIMPKPTDHLAMYGSWSRLSPRQSAEAVRDMESADAAEAVSKYKVQSQKYLFDGAVRLPALASDQSLGLNSNNWTPVIPDCFEYLEPRAAMEMHCRGVCSMPNVRLGGRIYQGTQAHEGGALPCIAPDAVPDQDARNVGEISGLDLSWMIPVGQDWRLHMDIACWAWTVPSLSVPLDYQLTRKPFDLKILMFYAAIGLWRQHHALVNNKLLTQDLDKRASQQIMGSIKGAPGGKIKEGSYQHVYMVSNMQNFNGEDVHGVMTPPGQYNIAMGVVASVKWDGDEPGTYAQIIGEEGSLMVETVQHADVPALVPYTVLEPTTEPHPLESVDVIRLSTEWSGMSKYFGDVDSFEYGELPSLSDPHAMLSYIAQVQAIEVNIINFHSTLNKYTHIFTDALTGVSYTATESFVKSNVQFFACTSMRSVDRTTEYCVEPCMMWQPSKKVTPRPSASGLSRWKFPVTMTLSPDISAMTQHVNGVVPEQAKLTMDVSARGYSVEVSRWRRPCLYNVTTGAHHPITCYQDLPHAYIGLPNNLVTLKLGTGDTPVLNLQTNGDIPKLTFIETSDGDVLWSTTDYARFVNPKTGSVEIDKAIWGTSTVVEPVAVHTDHTAIVMTMPRGIEHLHDEKNGPLSGGALSFGSAPKFACDEASGFCGQSASGKYESIDDCTKGTSCQYTYGIFERTNANGGTSGSSAWNPGHHKGGKNDMLRGGLIGETNKVSTTSWKIAAVVGLIAAGCIVLYIVLRSRAQKKVANRIHIH